MEAHWPLWNRIPLLTLIFIRMGALLVSMPMFGARSIPVPAKVGLALAFSWAFLPLIPLPDEYPSFDMARWGGAAIREAVIGLTMGWLVQLCLTAVPLAGQLVGYMMGFGIANVMDPLGQQQMSVMAQFLNLMAMWLFLAMNGHHLVIAAVLDSFRWLPPGGGGFLGGMDKIGLEAGRHLFRSAVMLAVPVWLILIFMKVAMGIVARTVPQMNVFFVGLPLQIGVGLIAIGVTLGFLAPWLARSLKWLDGVFLSFGRLI